MAEDIKFDFKGIDQLLKAFKDPPQARVGILGGGSRNPEEALRKAGKKFGKKSLTKETASGENIQTNAEIGAKHEFGIGKFPVRSFLRVPISEELMDVLNDETDLLKKETLAEVLKTGDLTPWMAKIGAAAEVNVQDAFNTGGRGKWIPSNYEHKNVKQTLVETGQLRKSITSVVVK